MKKLLTYLTVVMLGIAAASCQKEVGVVDAGEGNVTFTVQAPGVTTKAIADGTNVDVVYYEIYKAEDEDEDSHPNSINGGTPLLEGVILNFDGTAELNLNLLHSQEYVALFWAQKDGNEYYFVEDLRKVKALYPDQSDKKTLANDEARAAFCQVLEFDTYSASSKTVVLVRPFAQINLGTTMDDLDQISNFRIEKSSMTVTGVSTVFNVAAMKAGSDQEDIIDVVFSLADAPAAFTKPETLSANGETWSYAGMNYVLVPGGTATVDVNYSIQTNVGTINRGVPGVPVQTNYRTNILGNLLTHTTHIDIVVDEKFDDHEDKYEGGKYEVVDGLVSVKVESAKEFADAFADEYVERIVIVNDIEVATGLVVNRNMVFDLNGHKIMYTGNDVLFRVKNGATVTINGTDAGSAIVTAPTEVSATGGNGYVGHVSENAKLNINCGTYDAKATCTIAQVTMGKLNVYGGVFSVKMDNAKWNDADGNARYLLNCSDTPYENGEAVINVYGGSFYKFNPKNNAAETPNANFCPVGYTVVAENDWYTVVPPTSVGNGE